MCSYVSLRHNIETDLGIEFYCNESTLHFVSVSHKVNIETDLGIVFCCTELSLHFLTCDISVQGS